MGYLGLLYIGEETRPNFVIGQKLFWPLLLNWNVQIEIRTQRQKQALRQGKGLKDRYNGMKVKKTETEWVSEWERERERERERESERERKDCKKELQREKDICNSMWEWFKRWKLATTKRCKNVKVFLHSFQHFDLLEATISSSGTFPSRKSGFVLDRTSKQYCKIG